MNECEACGTNAAAYLNTLRSKAAGAIALGFGWCEVERHEAGLWGCGVAVRNAPGAVFERGVERRFQRAARGYKGAR